jgi:D-sedoheptulose 7-phosphate isomerase
MTSLSSYVSELTAVLGRLDAAAFDALVDEVKRVHADDKIIYTCGNGGSAATASHMINDLVKAPADASGCRPLRAIGLTDCIPLMTALANDIEYTQIFARQLRAYGRPGDLLIAISGSGNSPNILEAVDAAHEIGMTVAGFSGYDGGKLHAAADIKLHVPSRCMAQVEDVHLILEHALVEVLKHALAPAAAPAGP